MNNPSDLSYEQQRLWRIENLFGYSCSHNLPFGFQLTGDLDFVVLEDAVKNVVERHETLRTCYREVDGELSAFHGEGFRWSLEAMDLSSVHDRQKQDRMDDALKQFAGHVFTFQGEPLFRGLLIELGGSNYFLAFVFHHLICDAMSITKFVRELGESYNARKKNKKLDLPVLEAQFSDFVAYEELMKAPSSAIAEWKMLFEEKKFQSVYWGCEISEAEGEKVQLFDFNIDSGTVDGINALAARMGVNPYFIFLSTFAMAISVNGEVENFLVTTPVIKGVKRKFRNLIGFLTAPSLVPLTVDSAVSFDTFVREVEKTWIAQRRCHLSYLDECRMLASENRKENLSQVFFSFINYPIPSLAIDGIEAKPVFLKREDLEFEFFLSMFKTEHGEQAYVEYLADFLTQNKVAEICRDYTALLKTVMEGKINLIQDSFGVLGKERLPRIHLFSSFTLDPLVPVMDYWRTHLPYKFHYSIGGYGQVLQELYDINSAARNNLEGLNVILLRWEDVNRYGKQKNDKLGLREFAEEFLAALDKFSEVSSSPLLVITCPFLDRSREALQWEKKLEKLCQKRESLYYLSSQEVLGKYPVSALYDPGRDEIAHIPFHNEFYVALGTRICRFYFRLQNPNYKVAVIDCDNTLWKGAVGDVGAKHVEITHGHRVFQRALRHLKEKGMLLALASKNREKDVREVFRTRDEMVLSSEDLLTAKVNWNSKSQNICTIAQELNLSLDSFVVFDDNPAECSEISSTIGECSVWRVDNPKSLIGTIWGLDALKSSETDKVRTKLYRQDAKRKELRDASGGFLQFLEQLDLSIDLRPLGEGDVLRASQLTLRTNQFNNAGIRRKECEVQQLMRDDRTQLIIATVEDKYGQYGDVGLIIYTHEGDSFYVDTFLLSCRILGRGVEFEMLRYLMSEARKSMCLEVVISFVKTEKNTPFYVFLEEMRAFIPNSEKRKNGYTFSVQNFEDSTFEKFIRFKEAKRPSKLSMPDVKSITNISNQLEFQQWVAEHADTVPKIARLAGIQIEYTSKRAIDSQDLDVIKKQLREVFEGILNKEVVDENIDFFDAMGGSSLDFVELLVKIDQVFHLSLSLDDIIQQPTVAFIGEAILAHKEGKKNIGMKWDYLEDANEPFLLDIPKGKAETANHVLLTGATGNLGAYLLRELLESTPKIIHCLVRGKDEVEGLRRLQANFEKFHLWKEPYQKRVVVHTGDLSEDYFGMEIEAYETLSNIVGTIYHNAARVNFTMPYSKLKRDNVGGTKNIVKFAAHQKRKHIHFVSSNVVFDSRDFRMDRIIEEVPLNGKMAAPIVGGYAQSKWVCELLLNQAQAQGLEVTIYRPSGIFGAEDRTAHLVSEDVLTSFMLAAMDMGSLPEINAHVNLSPVDYVARALVCLSQQVRVDGEVFHLSHPSPVRLSKYVELVNEVGHNLVMKPYKAWVKDLKTYLSTKGINSFLKVFLGPIFLNKTKEIPSITWMEQALSRGYLDTSKTQALLPGEFKTCRPFDTKNIIRQVLLSFAELEKMQAKPPGICVNGEENKIVIIYAETGSCHKSKAALFKRELERCCLNDTTVEMVSLESLSILQCKITEIYNHLLRNHPHLYADFHALTNEIIEEKYRIFEEHLERVANALIAEHKPRLILSVHAIGSCLAKFTKKISPSTPFITYVTDWMGNCLRGWAEKGSDAIYCNSQRCAGYLLGCGADPAVLQIISPVLDPSFSTPFHLEEKEKFYQKLGLFSDASTFLFNTSGKLNHRELIERISSIEKRLNLLVLCYNNDSLFRFCEKISRPNIRIVPILWTDDMSSLMRLSDGVITKPGSGIMQEIYAANCRALVDVREGVMPQEAEIVDYMVQENRAVPFSSLSEFDHQVREFLISYQESQMPGLWPDQSNSFYQRLLFDVCSCYQN